MNSTEDSGAEPAGAANSSGAPASASAGASASASAPPPRGDAQAAASIGQSIRDASASAAQALAPVARKTAAGFADWLVSIGWGKFFLLSVLLLIFSGVAFSLFYSKAERHHPAEEGDISVNVHVVPLADGRLQIQAADDARSGASAAQPHPPAKGKTGGKTADDGVLLQIEGDGDEKNPEVRIDHQGVRLLADDEGGKVSVVIDHNGVHIEKLAPPSGPGKAAAGATPGASPAGVAAKPGVGADPEKVAEAVEAARDQIETILQEEVDDKLERLRRGDKAERGNWLATLAVLAIIVSIILKVVLGSKNRAESQARQASAAAAQEGLKRQLAEAQLKMMQAQVEPHFLFNTLASVDHLIETDPSRASRMQKNLIQYLRAALPQMREGTSSLGREIQQCRSYLEILKVRMDERLQFSINVPQGLQSAAFPPMMMLTLVENAIKHGLEPKPEGGSLSLSAVISNGALQVAVADSGLGFGVAQRGGTGVGLANVRERLQALFGSAAHLQIEANANGGTIATIVVPYRVDPEASTSAAGGLDPAGGVAAGATAQ